jgi:hypothetical protein
MSLSRSFVLWERHFFVLDGRYFTKKFSDHPLGLGRTWLGPAGGLSMLRCGLVTCSRPGLKWKAVSSSYTRLANIVQKVIQIIKLFILLYPLTLSSAYPTPCVYLSPTNSRFPSTRNIELYNGPKRSILCM